MRRGGTHRLSPERAARLRRALDRLERASPPRRRVPLDPVSLPHRYRDPRDIEVAALLAALLAYGRADLFLPRVERVLAGMGPSPAAFVRGLDVAGARALLSGFVYRFNVGADVAVLLLGMGRMLERRGSLEAGFVAAHEASGGDLPRRARGRSSASSGTWTCARWSGRWGGRAGWTTSCRCRWGRARRSGCTSFSAGWCAGPMVWTWASGGGCLRARSWSRWTRTSRGSRGGSGWCDGGRWGGRRPRTSPGNLEVIDPVGSGPVRLRALSPRDERRLSAAGPGRAVCPLRAAARVQRRAEARAGPGGRRAPARRGGACEPSAGPGPLAGGHQRGDHRCGAGEVELVSADDAHPDADGVLGDVDGVGGSPDGRPEGERLLRAISGGGRASALGLGAVEPGADLPGQDDGTRRLAIRGVRPAGGSVSPQSGSLASAERDAPTCTRERRYPT